MNTEDRRAPGATRLPFDGLVEVGGALGPSFEAQAVNVSEDGMHLRTAYLPEQGQPLTCRFDAGQGQSVLVSGEVVWSQGADKGGEFGIRFTDMDPQSVEALKRMCGVTVATDAKPVPSGSKVRLHIDGLASPMRARVRDARAAAVTVGSDLGFLQVGRPLELEDAQSGKKRPASIDRVEVAVDPASHVPQLIVTLRYADVRAPVPTEGPTASRGWAAPSAPTASDDLAAVEEASAKMKGALARNLTRVGPAIERLAERAKTMAALLAKRGDPYRSPVRRTTAPPPGGGLHATGRRVVRGDDGGPGFADAPEAKGFTTKRKAVIASAVMLSAVVGAIAIKKSHHDGAPEAGAPAASAATATNAAAPASATPPASPMPAETSSLQPFGPSTLAADDTDTIRAHKKHLHIAPFGNGPVHHGNILRLKMDSPIESIEGAQQPTGFTVKIPGRKAVEAAAPLAARDSRIAAIKVNNENAGAELSVTFKDGVPNYQVSARGETLVIALAPVGTLDETMAKKDEKGSKSKHAKHEKKGEVEF